MYTYIPTYIHIHTYIYISFSVLHIKQNMLQKFSFFLIVSVTENTHPTNDFDNFGFEKLIMLSEQ